MKKLFFLILLLSLVGSSYLNAVASPYCQLSGKNTDSLKLESDTTYHSFLISKDNPFVIDNHPFFEGYYLISKNGAFSGIPKSKLKKEDLRDINYLFLSICLFIISLFVIHISANSWFRHKYNEKYSDMLNKRNRLVDDRNFYVERTKGVRVNIKYEMLQIVNKQINEIDNTKAYSEDKKKSIRHNIPFFIIGFALMVLYLIFVFKVKNLPIDVLFYELLSFPLQFAFPFLFVGVLFSGISIVRFSLIQGGDLNEKTNRLSLFGVIVSLINFAACIMTIIQFIR